MKQRILNGVAHLFLKVSTQRDQLYERGLLTQHSIPGCTIISVGNIAMGGRGKTPLAQTVAIQCSKLGTPTALVLRGYKGSMEHRGGLVSNGKGPLVSAAEAGDEAFLAAHKCCNIVVRVGANRNAQVQLARDQGASIIVLDDGFQHRKIARKADIVCISPEDLALGPRFFPSGFLRESPTALQRATLLAGYALDWQHHPSPPPVLFELKPTALLTQSFESKPLTCLPHRVHLLCGVAVPSRVQATVQKIGTHIVSVSFFKDHHQFSKHDLQQIEKTALQHDAKAILTTPKDLARLQNCAFNMPILALDTELRCPHGMEHLNDIIENAVSCANS